MNIAIINNKGGTGKTTTCVNLAAALADSGYRVLLVDLDSQASASLSLGVARSNLVPSAAQILFGSMDAEEAIRDTGVPRLDLLTGQMDLANTDLMLADVPGREQRLSRGLSQVKGKYDFILFDCPPSLTMLSINALMVSEYYIVPMSVEYLALEGLISLMEGIDRMKQGMELKAELLGIIFTCIKPRMIRKQITKKIAGLIRDHYGKLVFETEIPKDVRLEEAPAYGKCIFQHAGNSRGAKAYVKLAREVVERCGIKGKGAEKDMKLVEDKG
jgi:chromosome partitioning protein